MSAGRTFTTAMTIRIAIGIALALTLPAISIDDYFRVYHAIFFWQKPSFASSTHWLPLHAWLEGPLVGLVGDARFAPRFASLAFGLVGAWTATRDAPSEDARRMRFALAVALPSSLVLFSSPLSEALFGALVATHVAAVVRYRAEGRVREAVVAVATLAAATALRYEAFLLLPLAFALLVRRASTDAPRSVVPALAMLLFAFPMRWLDHVATRTGDAFSFLDSLAADQYGASSPSKAFLGAALPVTLAFASACVATWIAWTRADERKAATLRIHGLYASVFVALIATLLLRDELPSQFACRLLHVPTLLAVPAIASIADGRPRLGAGLCALGTASGLLVCALVTSVVPAPDLVIGRRLRRELDADPRATAIVDGPFPEVTALVVEAGAVDRVRVESAGRRCRVRVATCDMPCGRPAWLGELRFVIASDAAREATFVARGFRVIGRSGPRRLLVRDRNVPICEGSSVSTEAD